MRRLTIILEDSNWDYPLGTQTVYVENQPEQYLIDIRKDDLSVTKMFLGIDWGLGEK
jgi:hypothetical protein